MADRITQLPLEVGEELPAHDELSQLPVEAMLCPATPTNARISLCAIEVMLCPGGWRTYEA